MDGSFKCGRDVDVDNVSRFRVAESRFAPAVLENEVVPLVRQVLQITDQLPALFQSVS